MRICLINPPTTAGDESLYFLFCLLALGGELRAAGHSCDVVDFDLLYRSGRCGTARTFFDRAVARLKQGHADAFGITTICANFPVALLLAERLRAEFPLLPIVLGGPQASSVAAETLEAWPAVDVVVMGEGENALVDLLNAGCDPDALDAVPGIAFRRGTEIVTTATRPLIADLDTLPRPDYALVDLAAYEAASRKIGHGFSPSVEAGRGCPFKCTFCSTKSMWVSTFRIKSPARLLDEMEQLHATYGYTSFPTIHDNFTTLKKYVEEVCTYFGAHNTRGLTWGASSRTDTLDPERLDRLYRAGCSGLFFGVESGSAGMQKIIRKGLRLDRFDPILDAMVERKMDATTSFIVGFPEEGPDDVDQTITAAYRYKTRGASRVFFTQLVPLAGTEVTRRYFDELTLPDEATSIARYGIGQGIGAARTRAMIAADKQLFSAFYRFPTPGLPDVHLEGLAQFYKHTIATQAGRLGRLFEMGLAPLELFGRWRTWVRSVHPRLASYESSQSSLRFFGRFTRETIGRRRRVAAPTLSPKCIRSPQTAVPHVS